MCLCTNSNILVIDQCEENNGGCEDLCIFVPSRMTSYCSCENIVKSSIGADKKTCVCPDETNWIKMGKACSRNFFIFAKILINEKAVNPCAYDNGGCEDECHYLNPGEHECECTMENSELSEDGKSCVCLPQYSKVGEICFGKFPNSRIFIPKQTNNIFF